MQVMNVPQHKQWRTLGLKVCIPVEFLELLRLTNLSQTAIPGVKARRCPKESGLLHFTMLAFSKFWSVFQNSGPIFKYWWIVSQTSINTLKLFKGKREIIFTYFRRFLLDFLESLNFYERNQILENLLCALKRNDGRCSRVSTFRIQVQSHQYYIAPKIQAIQTQMLFGESSCPVL